MKSIKEKLAYLISGGLLVAVGMTLSPVTAQRDKFGEIECTKLTVVDSEGNPRGVIKNVDDFFGGGIVELYNSDGTKTVELYAGKRNGGYVRVWSKNKREKGPCSVQLIADKNGGRLDIYGKGGAVLKRDATRPTTMAEFGQETSSVSVRVDSNGGGVVSVHDRNNGSASSVLRVNTNGGRLDVYGKDNHQTRATVQVNAHGNGAVSTWKKDGSRFHTLGEVPPAPHSITTIADVIESKIDGDFEGWDGETVVKLMNGQIWKQTQYHYEYHYAFMPDVVIYKSGGRYKMMVDGTDEAVIVERLK